MPSFITLIVPKRVATLSLLALIACGTAWLFLSRAPYPAAPPPLALQVQGGAVVQAMAVPGEPAPDFTLSGLDGRPVTLSDFRGRPVILYFWATWCHYCLETWPELQALQQEHGNDGLEVLAVNILENEDKVRVYARRHRLSLPILLDADAQVTHSYAVRATPAYYLIDRNGVLREVIIGAALPGELAERLPTILSLPGEG